MTAESTLWGVPAYLPYLQPALTPDIVRDAEARLGVTLPKSYLEMLQQQNGGYLRFELPNAPSQMLWGIGPHFPSILDSFDWKDSKAASADEWTPSNASLLVPFDGDGHWHLCFDYRANGPTSEPSEHEDDHGGARTFADAGHTVEIFETLTNGAAHEESDSVEQSGTIAVTAHGATQSIQVEGGTAC